MSERDFENLDERQRLAQEALQGLPLPQADPDFRARLKARFVAGEIPETRLSEPEAAPIRRIPRWTGWAGLAAAAVLAAVLVTQNPLPGPQLVSTNGAGSVIIDGRELAADQTGSITAALRPGASIKVGEGGSLDVLYPGSFVMRLGEGTDMVLPPRPGRWFGRKVESALSQGEMSVRTGPRLAGGSLTVTTPEARTVIHGTLVSVLRNDAVTCVCLFEGSAEVLTEKAALGEVPRGMRWVMFRDGSDPQLLEIVPAHQDHMLGLDAACATIFD